LALADALLAQNGMLVFGKRPNEAFALLLRDFPCRTFPAGPWIHFPKLPSRQFDKLFAFSGKMGACRALAFLCAVRPVVLGSRQALDYRCQAWIPSAL
jgi:hypothetical protein